ncbi:hypothetical protein EDD98_7503 [Streptomyces sp. PanSC19]|uniref:hypothetical protein n=1 Tax=Streptomyces sp. PanSC19 TaxID=1520455 RepID=UPI000F9CACF1|nr:hypothetical protein [Streptomyces sp. PanSC19]ROQ23559.1 hypothetical protein EDD98_7503 [Streptomyces sp. PanSC19]
MKGPYRFSVAENQFYVLGDGDPGHLKNRTITVAGNNGLSAGGKDHAVAIAGVSAGTAMISFVLSPSRLGPDASQPWEDIAEFAYISPTETAHLAACMGPDEETDDMEAYDVDLAFAGPGDYRMRLHARGRGINPDGVQEDSEPIAEHYLLQVWSAAA